MEGRYKLDENTLEDRWKQKVDERQLEAELIWVKNKIVDFITQICNIFTLFQKRGNKLNCLQVIIFLWFNVKPELLEVVNKYFTEGTVQSKDDTIVKPHSHSLKPCAVICGKGEV